MYVTIVHIHVKKEYVKDFIEASRVNHLASVKEPGNTRFDVLQMANDATHFALYEAYESAEEAALRAVQASGVARRRWQGN